MKTTTTLRKDLSDSGFAAHGAAYMSAGPGSEKGSGLQAWSSFVRNHARAVLARDFFVAVTATFRLLYVFVVLEVGTRPILHMNVADHRTAEWTIQQSRPRAGHHTPATATPQCPVSRREAKAWASRTMDDRQLVSERDDFQVQRGA